MLHDKDRKAGGIIIEDEARKRAAQRLIAAVQSGNPEDVLVAFDVLITLCGAPLG